MWMLGGIKSGGKAKEGDLLESWRLLNVSLNTFQCLSLAKRDLKLLLMTLMQHRHKSPFLMETTNWSWKFRGFLGVPVPKIVDYCQSTPSIEIVDFQSTPSKILVRDGIGKANLDSRNGVNRDSWIGIKRIQFLGKFWNATKQETRTRLEQDLSKWLD